MASALKNLINEPLVITMAKQLRRSWPAFDEAKFITLSTTGLGALEFKPRALHICAALEQTLPTDFKKSAPILLKAMKGPEAMSGWALWGVGEFVARHGLSTPEVGLEVLHQLTQGFTAEWAIRPFLTAHPKLAYATLAKWVRDESDHVRRLVSEGSRPLLPWGSRLDAAVKDPSPSLPLLRLLQDDPSEYVRRSVANHLNDIAKHHPAVIAEWLETHLPEATAERRSLLRHASRTLIKKGDARVLAAWGIGGKLRGQASLEVTPRKIALGEFVELHVTLESASTKPQELAIDYVVHHIKADGSSSPKVFKGWSVKLGAKENRALVKKHTVKQITTRRYYPGRHRVSLQINGTVIAESAFELKLP